MPAAGAEPITPQCTSSSIRTSSMAPIAPRIPWRICAPSRAGPAGAEQAMSRSFEPMTTSPLVPMSTRARSASLSSIRVASTQAMVSAPTKPATIGSRHTCAFGAALSGRSPAATTMPSLTAGA